MGLLTRRKEYTYRAATPTTFAAAAGAVAFFVISGSATRREVRVHKIRVSGIHLTTLAVETIVAEKWSTTAFTAGTAVVLTQVPLDNAFPAGSAGLVQVYTAAPTEGTLVGTVASRRVILKSTTVVDGASFGDVEFIFGDHDEAVPVILKGNTQSLSLAFATAPATAVTMSLEVEWTEE